MPTNSKNPIWLALSSSALLLLLSMLMLPSTTHAQSEIVKPVNYTYDEPVVFNQWCDEMREMFGPTCVCETRYGESNNINSVDLDHEINCDPLQGEQTCINNITIESARVWLRATSIGEVGNFQAIRETAITDMYVFLDDTSIDTISFRFNDRIGQRRYNCEAVFGAVNCARCGACDIPANNKSLEYPIHLGPADFFRGISGFCRYGNGPPIGTFNTCEDGNNTLTELFFWDLEITDADQIGACPGDFGSESDSLPDINDTILVPAVDEESGGNSSMTTMGATTVLIAAVMALLV